MLGCVDGVKEGLVLVGAVSGASDVMSSQPAAPWLREQSVMTSE